MLTRRIPYHPFLAALYPVSFLLSRNPFLSNFSETYFPALVMLLLAALMYWVLYKILRNVNRAALLVSVFFVLTFSYGSLMSVAREINEGVKHSHLIVVYILLLGGLSLLILRSKGKLERITQLANLMAVFMVLFNVGTVAYQKSVYTGFKKPSALDTRHWTFSAETAPDIYYFMLDGYAREDILKDIHRYDNSAFINALESRGFYVADSSRSNYPNTIASVSSMLNMEYHDLNPGNKKIWGILRNKTMYNKAFAALHDLGYDIYTFPNGISFTEIRTANKYVSTPHLDEFTTNLINMTPAVVLPTVNVIFLPMKVDLLTFPYRVLPEIIRNPSPKLVYVHTICPHPPFLFTADGKPLRQEKSNHWFNEGWRPRTGYSDQVQVINRYLLSAIDTILTEAKRPTVIVLQSDHGSKMLSRPFQFEDNYFSEQFSNLCAIRFQNIDSSELYPSITPVNILPLVFNHSFKAGIKLQPDISYFYPIDQDTPVVDVTSRIKAEEAERKVKGPPPTPWVGDGQACH